MRTLTYLLLGNSRSRGSSKWASTFPPGRRSRKPGARWSRLMPNGWFWYVNSSPNTFANHGYASTAARGLEFSIVHEPDGPHLQPGVVGGGERRIHDLSRRGQLGLGAAGAVTGPASTTLWVKGACSEEPRTRLRSTMPRRKTQLTRFNPRHKLETRSISEHPKVAVSREE